MAPTAEMEEVALDETERRRHLATIEQLTQLCGVSRVEVGRLYEAELERVNSYSRIRDFLPILIARKIKQDLRAYRSPEPAR